MMNIQEALKKVSVLGAGGKMGSGISLILLQEMARAEAEISGSAASGKCILRLIDENVEAFVPLKHYLRQQLTKYAEKNINSIRQYYEKNPLLISNEQVIRAFVEGAMDIVFCDTALSQAKDTYLVFEAVTEDIEVKVKIFKQLNQEKQLPQYYLTNTSSIPISVLDKKADLNHRIIGFHFYNPPPLKKIAEVVIPHETPQELKELACALAIRLRKQAVQANDVPGFIGNGYFIREALFALKMARNIANQKKLSFPEALWLVNDMTQRFLIRPMGIFQVIDYVGVDVFQKIAFTMSTFLADPTLHDLFIDQLAKAGKIGGQKNGICFTQGHAVVGMYDADKNDYAAVDTKALSAVLGDPPQKISWKELEQNAERHIQVKNYGESLEKHSAWGSQLAREYKEYSKFLVNLLVEMKVAKREDILTVLENGFSIFLSG